MTMMIWMKPIKNKVTKNINKASTKKSIARGRIPKSTRKRKG